MPVSDVEKKFEDAIKAREILEIKYQHKTKKPDKEIVTRKQVPIDIGSNNPDPKIRQSNIDSAWVFCYDHPDEYGRTKPKFHEIKRNLIISIKETGENFDPNAIADIILENQKIDLRDAKFVLVPDRDWFR